MDQRQLADELRQGHCWRYVDEMAAHIGGQKVDKKRATDWELVKTASTCFGCERSACDDEIKQAIAQAHDHESFNELIATCVEHALDCVYEYDEVC
jgi:hypothetical protein